MHLTQKSINRSGVMETLKKGSGKIAPLWSLENFVAVNPYMGMTDMNFEQAMTFLSKTEDVQVTLPVEFYLKSLAEGSLTRQDIERALEANKLGLDEDVESFIQSVYEGGDETEHRVKTLVDVASEMNGKKWRRFMVDRISFWASAYFDDHQAVWKTAVKDKSLFTAWKREAEVDFSPEAMGLKGFRKLIKSLPDDYVEAAALALKKLDIPSDSMEYYLNSLLMKMNGWAGFAARVDWDARLAAKDSQIVQEFLVILLVWEMSLNELLNYPTLDAAWRQAKMESIAIANSGTVEPMLARQLILQNAYDIARQRTIIQTINEQPESVVKKVAIKTQAAFCIDVRSEVFRRNLETVDSSIATFGFAGFFGFPIEYVPVGHEKGTSQCPVLLPTSYKVREHLGDLQLEKKAIARRTFRGQLQKMWKQFKSGAVSCFGFVSPLGIYFLPKLFTDLFGITRPVADPKNAGLSKKQIANKQVELNTDLLFGDGGIPLNDRIVMAQSVLNAMSLTENFAQTILLIGHGSSSVNNPHATGLDCGACGGHSGESNAKVAAAVMNDPEVRRGLKELGINIPDRTCFIAGLHDTTTDEIALYEHTHDVKIEDKSLEDLKHSLQLAGKLSREERASRMNITGKDGEKQVRIRSNDMSQVRPEWGLAGCHSFIVAPRERTEKLNFGGKAFMHSYSWKKDTAFKVLEQIMTAPMVVTSWINLQYFASTVDNKKFGAGNKTLHNIVGGVGVLEGFGGDLRVGLPWQSVHDGTQFQHLPNRLNVVIEAPVDEMSRILEKHDAIRNLCDNEWIYLFAMNEQGKVAYKYIGDLQWEVVE